MSGAVVVLLAFPCGAALGAVWLHLLARSVAGLLDGGPPARIVLLAAARLALAGAAFWLAALQGALPLIGGLAGFAAARLVLLGRIGERLR